MERKDKALVFMAIIVVLVIIYIFSNAKNIEVSINSGLRSVAKSIVGDQYKGWNTYTNQEYGYTIRYPKDFYIDTKESDRPFSKYEDADGSLVGGKTTIKNYLHPDPNAPVKSDSIDIDYVFTKFDYGVTADEYFDVYVQELSKLGNMSNIERFDLNGSPAVRYTEHSFDKYGTSFPHVISIKGDRAFVSTYAYFDGTRGTVGLADRIVNSFAFTK